eukprot:g65765.t1
MTEEDRSRYLEIQSSKQTRFLVSVDGSDLANRAFFAALRWKHPNDTLFLVHCVQTLAHPPLLWGPGGGHAEVDLPAMNKVLQMQGKILLDHYLEVCKKYEITNVTGTLLCDHQNIKAKLVDFAAHHQIDTIFVGSRGLGVVARMLLGSFSNYVLEHAHCNVMVIRDRHDLRFEESGELARSGQAVISLEQGEEGGSEEEDEDDEEIVQNRRESHLSDIYAGMDAIPSVLARAGVDKQQEQKTATTPTGRMDTTGDDADSRRASLNMPTSLSMSMSLDSECPLFPPDSPDASLGPQSWRNGAGTLTFELTPNYNCTYCTAARPVTHDQEEKSSSFLEPPAGGGNLKVTILATCRISVKRVLYDRNALGGNHDNNLRPTVGLPTADRTRTVAVTTLCPTGKSGKPTDMQSFYHCTFIIRPLSS